LSTSLPGNLTPGFERYSGGKLTSGLRSSAFIQTLQSVPVLADTSPDTLRHTTKSEVI